MGRDVSAMDERDEDMVPRQHVIQGPAECDPLSCRFQAKSASPVSRTARAAAAASPPLLKATVANAGLAGSR